jgi:hypothetical protein
VSNIAYLGSGSFDSKFGSSDDSHPMSHTKKTISRAVEFRLRRSWCHWEANSKIYKLIFHKSLLIRTKTRSKRPLFVGCPNGDFPA